MNQAGPGLAAEIATAPLCTISAFLSELREDPETEARNRLPQALPGPVTDPPFPGAPCLKPSPLP